MHNTVTPSNDHHHQTSTEHNGYYSPYSTDMKMALILMS